MWCDATVNPEALGRGGCQVLQSLLRVVEPWRLSCAESGARRSWRHQPSRDSHVAENDALPGPLYGEQAERPQCFLTTTVACPPRSFGSAFRTELRKIVFEDVSRRDCVPRPSPRFSAPGNHDGVQLTSEKDRKADPIGPISVVDLVLHPR